MSYFMTADPTVQINLIRVVFQAMKFTEEEMEKVLAAHEENNQSKLSKAVGYFFWFKEGIEHLHSGDNYNNKLIIESKQA